MSEFFPLFLMLVWNSILNNLGYSAACRGHIAEGVSKGKNWKPLPMVGHSVSNPMADVMCWKSKQEDPYGVP